MDDSFSFEISIPSDNDGYVLLQCEHCGSFFKATPDDIEDDGVLQIFCPCCGLCSENHITEDVSELAETIISNQINQMIFKQFKDLERHSNNIISFKAGKKPHYKAEEPIRSGIDELKIVDFECCHRTAKIKPLLKMTGCYCPFCGVKHYEFK